MIEIRCRTGVDLLPDYLEGVIQPELRVAIEAHVASCPRCLAFIRSYSETPRILREATAAVLPERAEASLRTLLNKYRTQPDEGQ